MPSSRSLRSGDFLKNFGRYVRKRRGEKSLSQQSLGELANLSDRTIREIEMGKGRETLHARTFEKLLYVLDGPDGERNFQTYCQTLAEQNEADEIGKATSQPTGDNQNLDREASDTAQSHGQLVRWAFGGAIVLSAFAVFALFYEFRPKSVKTDTPTVVGVVEPPKSTPTPSGSGVQKHTPEGSTGATADLKPEIRASLRDGNLQLHIKLASQSGSQISGRMELSRDGIRFDRGRHVPNFLPGDKLILQVRNAKSRVIAGPFDLTRQATDAVKQELAQRIDCRVGVCTLAASHLCHQHWSRLSLGRQADRPEFSVDLQSCGTRSEQTPVRLCFSTPHDLFPFGEGQKLHGVLYARSGGKFEFPVPIKKANRIFGFDNAPTNARHKLSPISPAASTPPATIWFVPTPSIQPHHFRIDIGVASCGRDGSTPMTDFLGLEAGFRAIYHDVDGKGYVKGQLRNFGIPLPSGEAIEILLEGKNGTTFGPYRYKFERDKIVQKAIAATQKPIEFNCKIKISNRLDPNSWRHHCHGPTRGSTLLNWAHVKEIHIGYRADSLTRKIKIDLNSEAILERLTNYSRKNAAPIFEFYPPRDQASVYFLLHYSDGTNSILQRLKLPKRI